MTMESIHISHDHNVLGMRRARSARMLEHVLLLAGVISSVLYVATDLLTATSYPGYSIADQAVSELSAIGAPTRFAWLAMGPFYTILLVAFGIGVRRADAANKRLRITGGLVIAFAGVGLLWPLFPMHSRGTVFSWTDVGHIVLASATVLFILLFTAVGGTALGRAFRVFSVLMIVAFVVAGGVSFAWADRIAAGRPTPWLGAVERVNVYGYLLWIFVLAVALLRRRVSADETP
jgi:hypothetical protein